MKKNPLNRILLCAVACSVIVLQSNETCLAKPGLVLVAHGSPSPTWNEAVMKFEAQIQQEAQKEGIFQAVRVAMLEFAEPSVPEAVAELEAQGCDSIVAVPLFIAPSGHSLFDVPAVLGIYHSPEIAAVLKEEGVQVARPKVPICLTGTFSSGDLLERYALSEIRKLSRNPEEEAIVFLLHGDDHHRGLIEERMRRLTTRCCGEAKIGHGDWAYIGVGQKYLGPGTGMIKQALEKKARVLVIGIYVSLPAKRLHDRVVGREKKNDPGFSLFEDDQVVFSRDALIGYEETIHWVLEMANGAVKK